MNVVLWVGVQAWTDRAEAWLDSGFTAALSLILITSPLSTSSVTLVCMHHDVRYKRAVQCIGHNVLQNVLKRAQVIQFQSLHCAKPARVIAFWMHEVTFARDRAKCSKADLPPDQNPVLFQSSHTA